MAELQKQKTPRQQPLIDFDEWAALAKSDPEAFEARRRAVIEEAIGRSHPASQQRLRCIQWKVDQIRERATNPLSACVKISEMMWDSLVGRGGLKEVLEQIDNHRPALPKAKVLGLPQPPHRYEPDQ